jgi:2'-5' RNA ligase
LQQLSLLEQDDRPRHRYFFGVHVESAAAARIAEATRRWRAEHRLSGAPIPAERLHVTLHHLGDYDAERGGLAATAIEAMNGLEMAPFEVGFDRTMSFWGKQSMPFVLCGSVELSGIAALQRALGLSMAKAGLGKWVEKTFTPHVTLLYDDRRVAEQAVEPIRWTVRDFVLMHSLLGETRHTVLGRWDLRG